jgi:hypothetical protein
VGLCAPLTTWHRIELEIQASLLLHRPEKLRNEDLVDVRRQGTFLRCFANTEAPRELLAFLYTERCGRNPTLFLPVKVFEFTEAECARIRGAVETWDDYDVNGDRRWQQPLRERLAPLELPL